MKEILRFKYKDTELCLLEQNGNLIYVKIVAGDFNYEVSEEEKSIINKVLSKLTPSKNIYDLGIIHYNMKSFHHFFDVDRNFHLFYEGKDLKMPNEEDSYKLNLVFNNQEEYFTHPNIYRQKEKRRAIKRIIKIGTMVVIITLTTFGIKLIHDLVTPAKVLQLTPTKTEATLSIPEIPNNNIPTAVTSDIEILPKEVINAPITYKEITLESLMEALAINSSLNSSEKEFLKMIYTNMPDFIPYLKGNLNYSLKNLKILYNNTESDVKGLASKVFGSIEIYSSTDFSNCPKDILAEEAIHMLNSEEYQSVGNTFYDFLCQRLVKERFSNTKPIESQDANDYVLKYCEVLAEFISPETLKEFTVNSNFNLIIQELMKIIPNDYNLAYNLLANLDKYATILTTCNQTEDVFKWQSELFKTRVSIEAALNEYYRAKYEINNEVNLNILYTLNREEAIRIIGEDMGLDSETIKTILENIDCVSIQTPKSIFDNKTNMILNIPYYMKVTKKIYHRDQLLTGVDGLKYETLSDLSSLPHPTKDDYDHYVYTFDDTKYTIYEVPSDTISRTLKTGK